MAEAKGEGADMSVKRPKSYAEWFDVATEVMDVCIANGCTFRYDPRRNAVMSALANVNATAKKEAFIRAIEEAATKPEVVEL